MAIAALPAPVRRAGYRVAHMLLRVYWRVLRSHTRGVKFVVRQGDAVLFVGHAYRERRSWQLPGGGIKRGEEPRDTPAREVREELGLYLADWRVLRAIEQPHEQPERPMARRADEQVSSIMPSDGSAVGATAARR